MAEYIDRHALKNDGHLCWHDGKGNVYYEVDHAPTADVVEVRHGKWSLGKSGCMYFCSHCNYAAHPREEEEWNYCPNCGAKMNGKDDNDG